jgi:hypothetical protein
VPAIVASFFPETRAFIEQRFGAAGRERLGAALAGEAREKWNHPPGEGWVDFALVGATLQTVREVFGGEDAAVVYALGRHNAEMNLAATERMLMKLISIKMVLKIASFLWGKRVKDGGELSVASTGPRSVRATLRFPVAHADWFEYLRGWFVRTIELAGGRAVRATLEKPAERGYAASEYAVAWE